MTPLLRTPEPEVQVWPSYTDVALNILLVLLLCLFVQATVSSRAAFAVLEIQERQSRLESAVLKEAPQGVTPHSEGDRLRFSFSDKILFDSGRADLKPTGQAVLRAVGSVLAREAVSFKGIQIEGHTDNVPIKAAEGFSSNWELSSARATSVVRFFQDQVGLPPALLSATGYSEYHPVGVTDTEEGRALNRRIDVVVVYSREQSDQ
jgi:flagellar motor protein MotB